VPIDAIVCGVSEVWVDGEESKRNFWMKPETVIQSRL
jgi:hypothetical protein